MNLNRFQNFMPAILDPLYEILKIQFEIHNQRPQKPPNTELCENRRVSKISCPPYWTRQFEKCKSDVKFAISDLRNLWVQSSTKIVGFPKYYVFHIGSAILNSGNPIHNKPPRKLLNTEFCGNCVVFQNYMSDILDIRHLTKGIAIWDQWDNFFLAVQLFRSALIIVRIKS